MNERVLRQLNLPGIGKRGQRLLENSSVTVIGAGGLGSTLLYCLCAAGVGKVTVADSDSVSITDLNRQFLYSVEDIGGDKATVACRRLKSLAPEIVIEPRVIRADSSNVQRLLQGVGLAVCAVDNINTRLDVNAACVELGIPLVSGGTNGMSGIVQAVMPGKTPCLACCYNNAGEMNPGAAFAPVVSTVASLMAQEALSILLELGNPLNGEAIFYDGLRMTTERIHPELSGICPVCGRNN